MLKFVFFILFTLLTNPIEHIHKPFRLRLLDPNKKVSGVVKKLSKTLDGDIHIRLKTKDTIELTRNNILFEDSCLVLEIVCASKTSLACCKDFQNDIPIPSIGDSVIVNGLYVFDKRHGLNEIHPVLKLAIIKHAL